MYFILCSRYINWVYFFLSFETVVTFYNMFIKKCFLNGIHYYIKITLLLEKKKRAAIKLTQFKFKQAKQQRKQQREQPKELLEELHCQPLKWWHRL